VPLGGHVRGHCGVAVRTEGGWLLHAGDAYFHGADVPQQQAPASTGGRVPRGLALYERSASLDWKERCANVERLRELARDHGGEVRVVPAHDADELAAVRAAAEGSRGRSR
jgi:glyoxylase-like metal-dependent hydrolase (beta-lactamase superfamily II)